MKTTASKSAAAAVDRTLLDWPRESGQAAQFRERVETHLKTRRRRRRAMKRGVALSLLGVFALLWAVPYLRDTATEVTPAAQRQTLALADGSQADLNARTQMHTDFRYGRRVVRLEHGEAFFSVAKDPAHPFLVETPAGTIRVTGTQFNVRLKEGGATEVTLLEGAVVFSGGAPGTRQAELAPGQQLDSSRPNLRTLSTADLENVTAWRQGQLAFDGLTLAEAVARIDTYHGVKITVAPEIAGLEPGGTFALDDLPALLRALENALSVKVLRNDDGSYRVVRPLR